MIKNSNHRGYAKDHVAWCLSLVLVMAAGIHATTVRAEAMDGAGNQLDRSSVAGEGGLPAITLPRTALGSDQLAVIINERDPHSVALGRYYQKKRGIPAHNMIRVGFRPYHPNMPVGEFRRVIGEVARQLDPEAQAFALTWAQPFRVDCMSITSAFAFGEYDKKYCASGCKPTSQSPYYDSKSINPAIDHGIRPTMSIAGVSLAQGKHLINRGVAADASFPDGTAYLMETSDRLRSTRAGIFPKLLEVADQFGSVELQHLKANSITGKDDVMFYFTGLAQVPDIKTNSYLPGAMADHLTSLGGVLIDSGQMSALRWLEAGATGSYGAVVEPCNFPSKFPNPGIAMFHYTRGATLIEAYWKSVAMPGQGIFVGEPLARPFGGYRVGRDGADLLVTTNPLPNGQYQLLGANSPVGPYLELREKPETKLKNARLILRFQDLGYPYYKFSRVE
jgi:uncharacterized protein (TIGR03790 family)